MLEVMDLRWASADHPAPVAMVVASNYPMPSGRHLRDPTLRMAATRANPSASACPFNPDLVCQLDRVSERTQVLMLQALKMA
ncbi:hypothetical protein SLS64_005497 [Diaporthe eres]